MVNKELLMSKIVAAGYNQKTFSEKLGISKNNLNEKINNRRPFDTDLVLEMCDILNIASNVEKVNIFLHNPSRKRDKNTA